jgi:hypothetical protein
MRPELQDQSRLHWRRSHARWRHIVHVAPDNRCEAGFESQMVLESETIASQAVTAEGAEGINAFVEKRKPDFSGGRHSPGHDNPGRTSRNRAGREAEDE